MNIKISVIFITFYPDSAGDLILPIDLRSHVRFCVRMPSHAKPHQNMHVYDSVDVLADVFWMLDSTADLNKSRSETY